MTNMDTKIIAPQPHQWELLGQLALLGQDERIYVDAQILTRRITDLLQSYLACPSGILTTVQNGKVFAQSDWSSNSSQEMVLYEHGMSNNAYPKSRLSLRNGSEEIGYLVLTHEPNTEPESFFYDALAAQISLLLIRQSNQPSATTRKTEQTPSAPKPTARKEKSVKQETNANNQQTKDLEQLYHISKIVASTQDHHVIFSVLLESVTNIARADQAHLIVYDRKKEVCCLTALFSLLNNTEHVAFPLQDNPAIAWVNEHQIPLLSTHPENDPLFAKFRKIFRDRQVLSALIVPLIVGGDTSGCILIEWIGRRAEPLDTQQCEICQIIAYHASRIIENNRLFTESQINAHALQEKVGELSTVLEAARILGSLLQSDEVLNSLMDLVSRRLHVSTVALWTIGKDNTLRPAAMYGIPIDTAREMRVPVGQGLTGHVAQTGKPLIVTNVEETGKSLYPDFNRRNMLTSFMGVPVFYRERIIGVLSVMTSHEHAFTNDEMMLMSGLAGQAAIALENARLFQEREQRIRELTTINQVSSAINSTLDLDEMLLILHRGISEILDTSHSFVALYDVGSTGQSPILRKRVVCEGNKENIRIVDSNILVDGKGLVDYVVLESKSLLLSTAEEIISFIQHQTTLPSTPHSKTDTSTLDYNSWLGVPILLGNTMLGIICLQSTICYAYSHDDQRFLSTIASHAAIAVSNARLFGERERRLREITVLKDIGSAISSTLDLQNVLERLYYELGQAIDMSTCVLGIYDEETNILSYPVCYHQGTRLHIDPTPLPEGTSGWTIRNRQPLLLHTLEQYEQMGFKEFGHSVFDVRLRRKTRHPRSKVIQSHLVVPITTTDNVLGVISIKSYKPYAFDEDDLRFVITVANQVAVTISNVQMFIERERRIQELATFNEIGQALSATVSIDELPTLIYRQTSRLLDTTNFYMALYDEEQDQITFPVFYEQGVERLMNIVSKQDQWNIDRNSLPINPNLYNFILYLIWRVIHKRETLLLRGSDLDHVDLIEELKEEKGVIKTNFVKPRSWLGVPMIVADKVVGVIGIQSYEKKSFGSYEIYLLSTIASWSAISLQNARLFDEIRNLAANLERRVGERTMELREANIQLLQEKEYLETVHAITLELTATLNLESIINRALEISSKNLGVSRGSIMLREIENGTLICRAVLQEQGVVRPTEFPISFGKSEGLVGWVMQHQQPVCIDDVWQDSRWVIEAGRAEDVRSVAAAPLMTGDTTLGVLILSSSQPAYFSRSQLHLLATIANEVAIAINNAQLYNYINEMASRLADLLEHQKEENTRSHAILQSLTEGVIVLDEDDHVQLMNRAAEHMLNIHAQEVLEKHVRILETYGKTKEQQQRADLLYTNIQKGLQKVTSRDTIYSMSIELPNPEQTIAMNIAPVRSMDERYYGNVAVLRDITREIESDRTKREFISKVSHELRTPLTSIKGYVDVLLLGSMGELNENQKHFLTVVKTNSNRLMDLINDILDISHIESGKIKLKFTQVDLHAIIHDVAQSLQIEAEAKHLTVRIDIQEDLPIFDADQRRLTQIIFNLLSNAVKYTFEYGHIHVRAFLNPAHLIQVEVEDTGVGMTPEQCSKLFRPFYRADNPLREIAGGTGLGLSITKSLVEQHGGELWVVSEQGKGSTFHVVMPLEQTVVPDKPDEELE